MKPSSKTPEGKQERTNKMKKNLYVILGTTAVLATAIAVAACATKKNTAKAAAQPQFRETIVKETIAPDEGQNPVMNFIGNYYGGRACVSVEAKGSDEAEITVVWGDSYNTKAVWTMSGTFNEATTSVFYDNAIKKMITLNEKGEVIFEEYLYTSGRGEFVFSYDGVTWNDLEEHMADTMVFRFGNSVEEVCTTIFPGDVVETIPSEPTATPTPKPTDKPTATPTPKPTEKPSETEAKPTETTAAPTEPAATQPSVEVTEPAPKTAADINGVYKSGRVTVEVDSEDPENVQIWVIWTASHNSKAVWSMSGKYDPATETISYENGTKKVFTYTEEGEPETETVEYTNDKGVFVFSYNGVTWDEYNENIAEGMVFIKEV